LGIGYFNLLKSVSKSTPFYNKNVRTRHGDEYKISPYHVLWPIPQSAVDGNSQGIINQNKGYSGFERNIPPLTEIPK